jgi:acid phosphatase (class A)
MKHLVAVAGAVTLLSVVWVAASAQESKAASDTKPAKVRVVTFIHPDKLPLASIVPAPPADGSEIAKAEFRELHRIQDARTPEQVKAAQADDAEEDIFIYKTVLGAGFNAQAVPLTAALSAHVHGDEPIASDELKKIYAPAAVPGGRDAAAGVQDDDAAQRVSERPHALGLPACVHAGRDGS